MVLATPVQARWAHEWSGCSDRGRIYEWIQQHRLPLPKAGLAITATDCPTCQQWRLTLTTATSSHPRSMAPFLKETSYLGGGKLVTLGPPNPRRSGGIYSQMAPILGVALHFFKFYFTVRTPGSISSLWYAGLRAYSMLDPLGPDSIQPHHSMRPTYSKWDAGERLWSWHPLIKSIAWVSHRFSKLSLDPWALRACSFANPHDKREDFLENLSMYWGLPGPLSGHGGGHLFFLPP